MWVGAKQVISRNKPSKSARRRVLKLGRDPWESAGENFVTEGSRQAARGTDLRSPSGAGWAPRRGLGGLQIPATEPGPAGFCFLSGAAGRSWPRSRPRFGPLRVSRSRLHGPGPGDTSRRPRRPPTRLRTPGRARAPGEEVPQPEVTGSCPLSAAGGSSSLGGADSAVCQAVAAASPDSPVGGGPRETAGRHSQCPGSSRERAADGGSRRRWGRGTVS